MSDPAEEAAVRAFNAYDFGDPLSPEFPVAAAREALALIRALHIPCSCDTCGECDGFCDGIWCEHCGHEWPCPTARLCYRSDELGGEQ